jgi:hypothetical protein
MTLGSMAFMHLQIALKLLRLPTAKTVAQMVAMTRIGLIIPSLSGLSAPLTKIRHKTLAVVNHHHLLQGTEFPSKTQDLNFYLRYIPLEI